MDQILFLAQVRSLIRTKFRGFGAPVQSFPDEAMLIREGFYCGRRFSCDGFQAVWFVEENEIKFYDRDGTMIEAVDAKPENLPTAEVLRNAA